MVVCLVPLNGSEEVSIQAEGVLVVVEEATLLFQDALGMVLRARVDIDQLAWVIFDALAWEFLALLELLEVH